MARASRQNPSVRAFILENVDDYPGSIATRAAKQFGLSRTAISRYMRRLVNEGLLSADGRTVARRYRLKPLVDETFKIEISPALPEDVVWRFRILPLVKGVKQTVVDICQYGFTEMLNNVIDHSESKDAIISYAQNIVRLEMEIIDHGVGIFEKIKNDFNLPDARAALLELSKGKLTSNALAHSGEGIFFTSRMFHKFHILSGNLFYSRTRKSDDDWLIETEDKEGYTQGTCVFMQISLNANWTMKEVFEKYQGENLGFRKTHVPLKLGNYPGEQLVSRSQAKRVLTRFENFSEVLLDFRGVSQIGQPFADEIFRVFQNSHPETKVLAIHTNAEIRRMIDHVRAADKNPPSSPK